MRKRPFARLFLATVGIAILGLALFALNGAVLAPRNKPLTGTTMHPAAEAPAPGATIRIFAWNIAKLFLHKGRFSFESTETVRMRLKRIAGIISAEHPDMVFLEEAVFECGLCPVNQVVELAEATGMHFWAYGENYDLGVPLLRMSGGNAILCRWPLEPVGNPDLPNRKPFWVSTNNRRILWCSFAVGKNPVLVGVVHADSFSLARGAQHLASILDTVDRRPAILAGDFNAEPQDRSMELVKASGLFSGEIDGGAPTHLAPNPTRRIDFALAPRAWQHLGTRVLNSDASDHAAVVADFRIP